MTRFSPSTTLLVLVLAALPALTACSDSEEAVGLCSPDLRECLDEFNFRVCKPDGASYDYDVCPQDSPCSQGLCRPGGTANNDATNNDGVNNGGVNNGGVNNDATNNGGGNNGVNNGGGNNGVNNGGGNNGVNNGVNNGGNNGSCEPFSRRCASPNLAEVCNASGTSWDLVACQQGMSCDGGTCGGGGNGGACDVRECIDATTVICYRGESSENLPCDFGQYCDGGSCRELTDCVDNDQDGYGTGTDCLGPDCNDNDYNANPSGRDFCGDGIDQDCELGDAPCNCDPLQQNCPGDRLKCGLANIGVFECRPDGMLAEGEPCGGIPSSCERGTICIGTGPEGSVCTRMCNPNNGEGCIGGAICGATLQNSPEIGLCTGFTRCDPVDSPNACPNGEYCQPISNRDAGCFDGGGAAGENAACTPGQSTCGPGLTCINANNQSVCKAWCKVGRGNTDCTRWQGQACQQIEYQFTLNGRTENISAYGICN